MPPTADRCTAGIAGDLLLTYIHIQPTFTHMSNVKLHYILLISTIIDTLHSVINALHFSIDALHRCSCCFTRYSSCMQDSEVEYMIGTCCVVTNAAWLRMLRGYECCVVTKCRERRNKFVVHG